MSQNGADAGAGQVRADGLSGARRWIVLILVSMGSSTIYGPAYLKNTFYDAQLQSLQITNTQVGQLMSAYAWTAVVLYLFSGLIADRVRMRTLSATGFFLTAGLTLWYAMLPSFPVLVGIFIGMGVSTILLWWGCRYKLVRLISTEEDYSRSIGISYGFYGAAGLLMGVVGTWVLNASADDPQRAFQTFLLVYAVLIALLGVLSLVFIPRFEGEISAGGSVRAVLADAGRALVNPVVLLTAATLFFVYFFYTCTSYTAPYMTALGADSTVTNMVSVVRTYGITLLAGPVFGMLAHKAKKSSVVIWTGSVLAAVAFVVVALLPGTSGSIIAIAVLAVALGFIANGVFGICSGLLTEGKVPLSAFGAATGVLSVIGFLPDTFSAIWLGSVLDRAEEAGDVTTAYPTVFWILAAIAAVAAAAALALARYVRTHGDRLDAAYQKALAEAAPV
jgi:MFS family permease